MCGSGSDVSHRHRRAKPTDHGAEAVRHAHADAIGHARADSCRHACAGAANHANHAGDDTNAEYQQRRRTSTTQSPSTTKRHGAWIGDTGRADDWHSHAGIADARNVHDDGNVSNERHVVAERCDDTWPLRTDQPRRHRVISVFGKSMLLDHDM